MKKLFEILLIGILTLSLVACGSGETNKGDDKVGEGKVIGVIVESFTNTNYVIMAEIFEEYGKELGYDVRISDAQNDPAKAVEAAENYATAGVDVLIFTPMDEESATSAVETAKGINPDIITIMSALSPKGIDFSVEQDDYNGGYEVGKYAGEWLKDNADENTQIGIVTLEVGFETPLTMRVEGFQKGIEEVYGKEIEYITQSITPGPGRTGYEIMEDWIQGFPDIKLVFGAADGMSLPSYEAAKAAGLNLDKYAFYGVDGTDDALKAISEDSSYKATADTGARAVPYAIIDVATKLLAGTSPEDLTVVIPPTLVNKDNVNGWEYDLNKIEFTEK